MNIAPRQIYTLVLSRKADRPRNATTACGVAWLPMADDGDGAADADVTVISRRDADDAVLMSLDTYNSMVETMHLLRSPENARHLAKSIAQYQKGQVKTKGVLDAK